MASEIKQFDTSATPRISSLVISIVVSVLILVFLFAVSVLTYKVAKPDDKAEQSHQWYGELFEGVRLTKFAKGFNLY